MKKTIFIFIVLIGLAALAYSQSITIEETYPGFTNAQVCAKYGGYVYLLDHYNIYSYDPSLGSIVDTLNVGEYVRNIDFSGSKAVVVAVSTIYLIDISYPTDMASLDMIPVSGSMGWDVAIEGSIVTVAAQSQAMVIEIVGDSLMSRGVYYPISPFPMVRSIEINGETMYVGDANGGIYSVDVSTPSSPILRMTTSTPGNKVGLEVIPGDKLIVADGAYTGVDSTSVRIFDIPSPTSFTELGAWVQLGGDAIGTSTPSPYNRLALADGEGGVKILDISDPDSPYLVVEQTTTDMVNGVSVSGDTIFVAGRNNFYVMTTDAFIADTDTVVTHVPATIDSVCPDHLIISACQPYFEWYYTEGSEPIDPGSVVIEINGETFTGFDIEVFVEDGIVGIDMEGYSYSTYDTIVGELVELYDEAGSTAVGLGLSATIVLDLDSPQISDVFPADGDSVREDSVVITGELMDIGPGPLADTEFRVIVDGVSYSPAGSYLDFTPPDFVCTPMGSFSPGDEVELCFLAEDMPDECVPNILDTCWNFYITTTGIEETEQPNNFSISAYPNPFNAATVFYFSNMARDDSPLLIYDIHGRIVDRIERNEFTENRAVWEPSSKISSGLYFAKIHGGNLTRVVLLR